MPSRNVCHVLLLTADSDLAELYRHECPDRVVTIAKDPAALSRKPGKHRFDAIILESHKDWINDMKVLSDTLGPPPVMTLVGSAAFLRRAGGTVKGAFNRRTVPRTTAKLPPAMGRHGKVGGKTPRFLGRRKPW